MSQLTSTSEFDLEKRVQITNEVVPYDIYKALNSTIKNDFWKWVLGTVDTQYNMPYATVKSYTHNDEATLWKYTYERDLNSDEVFKKVTNGYTSPVYGPSDSLAPTEGNLPKNFKTYHSMNISGVVLPEFDLLLHEVYRYLDTLYPDHPDYAELLTKVEVDDAIKNAGYLLNYNMNTSVMDKVVEANGEFLSELEQEKESLMLKVRNLRDEAIRKKVYGTKEGYRMLGSGIWENIEVFPVGTYLPLKQTNTSELEFEKQVSTTLLNLKTPISEYIGSAIYTCQGKSSYITSRNTSIGGKVETIYKNDIYVDKYTRDVFKCEADSMKNNANAFSVSWSATGKRNTIDNESTNIFRLWNIERPISDIEIPVEIKNDYLGKPNRVLKVKDENFNNTIYSVSSAQYSYRFACMFSLTENATEPLKLYVPNGDVIAITDKAIDGKTEEPEIISKTNLGNLNKNVWYLVVSYLYNSNSKFEDVKENDAGVYSYSNGTLNKVDIPVNSFVMSQGFTSFTGINTLENSYIYNIRCDLINGKEPTIEGLFTARNKTQFRGTWTSGVYYYANDIVEYNGKNYFCNYNNTASNALSIANTTFWSVYKYPSALEEENSVDSLIEFNEAMGTSFTSDEYLEYTHKLMRNIDIYSPNYYKKFRLIDWDGTLSSYSQYNGNNPAFYAVSIPTMRYTLAEIPVVSDIDSNILNCELNDSITSPKDDEYVNYVDSVREDYPYSQAIFNLKDESNKTIPVTITEDADTMEEVHTIQTQSLNDTCTTPLYYFPSQKALLSLEDAGYNEYLNSTASGHNYDGSLVYVKDRLGLMGRISATLNPYVKDSIIFENDVMAGLYKDSSDSEKWSETEINWSEDAKNGINRFSYISNTSPVELEEGEASTLNLYVISDMNKGKIRVKFEEFKSASVYDNKNAYAIVKDPSTNKCSIFGGTLTTDYKERDDAEFPYSLFGATFDIGFIPSDDNETVKIVKNRYNLDISKNYVSELYGNVEIKFVEAVNQNNCWSVLNDVKYFSLGSLNIFPIICDGNFTSGSMTEDDYGAPADIVEELWDTEKINKLEVLTIKEHEVGYSQMFSSFRNYFKKSSFKLSTKKIAENGKIRIICSSDLSTEDTRNILEVAESNEDLISTLNVGDLVFGPGVDNDDEDVFITKINGRNIYLSSNLYTQAYERTYTFATRMSIKPNDVDLFENYKEKIIDFGTFKKIDPFSNGFYRSTNWPHSSKALMNGIADVSDFKPWNNYSSFNIIMNYIYGPAESNKKLMPSTIKYMNDLFVELNADKLLNLKTKSGEISPCLMSVDILDYFTDNVKEIARASDNVNFGVNINLECDTMGFDYWKKQMKEEFKTEYKYTDENIQAKFSVLPNLWKEVESLSDETRWCIPYYAQVGTGANDLTYVIKKEYNNLNATIWGSALYEYTGAVTDYRFELIYQDEIDFIDRLWDITDHKLRGEYFYKAKDADGNIIYISSNQVYDIIWEQETYLDKNNQSQNMPNGYIGAAYEKTYDAINAKKVPNSIVFVNTQGYEEIKEDNKSQAKVIQGDIDEKATEAVIKNLEEKGDTDIIPWVVPTKSDKEKFALKIYGVYKYVNNLESSLNYSLISYVNSAGALTGEPFYVLSSTIDISDSTDSKKAYFYENKQIKIIKINNYNIADIERKDVPAKVVSIYGHQDMDENLLKELNNENYIIYTNVNAPLFEIPIGEYDIQLKYERNNEVFTTVQANFYKQSFKNLKKYLSSGEIRVNASVESNNSGAFLYNLQTVKDGWQSQSASTGVNDLDLISGLTIEYGGEWTPERVWNNSTNGYEISWPNINANKYMDNTLVYYFIPEERVLGEIYDNESNTLESKKFIANSIVFTKVYIDGATNNITDWEYREFQACNTIDNERMKSINNSSSEMVYSLDGSKKERNGINPPSFQRVSFLDSLIGRFLETTSVYDEDSALRIKESTFVYLRGQDNKVWSEKHIPAWDTIQTFSSSMMDVILNKCFYVYLGEIKKEFVREQGEPADIKIERENEEKTLKATFEGIEYKYDSKDSSCIKLNYRTQKDSGTQINKYFKKVDLRLDSGHKVPAAGKDGVIRNPLIVNIDKLVEYAKATESFYEQSTYYSVYWAEVTEKDDDRYGTPVDTDKITYSHTKNFEKIKQDFKTSISSKEDVITQGSSIKIEDIDLVYTWYNWLEQKVQASGEGGENKKFYFVKDLYSILYYFKALGNGQAPQTDFDSGVTYIAPTGNDKVCKKLKDSLEEKVLYYIAVSSNGAPFGGTYTGLDGKPCELESIIEQKDIIGVTVFEEKYVILYFDRNKKNTSIIPIEQLSVNGYLEKEWSYFSEPSLGFNTISIIDNVISKIQLPRKSITDGSYDFEITLDPKFIGLGYKYLNGAPNKYDDGGNEDISKITSFNLTKSAIKYDSENDEYYVVSNEFSNGKFSNTDEKFAIKFNEQKFFKNIVHSVGAYQLRPELQNNSSSKEYNPTFYSIDGQVMNGEYLSADDRILSVKEIYLRSIYNQSLESRFFNNYLNFDLQLREFDISDNSMILGSLATPNGRVELYDTLTERFNKEDFTNEIKVKNIEVSKYNDNISDLTVTEKYYKNNLIFIGSMNLATPNRIELPLIENLESYYNSALKSLSNGDTLEDIKVLDIVISDDNVAKNKGYYYDDTLIQNIAKVSYNDYFDVLIVATDNGDIYYQFNPDFSGDRIDLSNTNNVATWSQLGTLKSIEYSEDYGIVANFEYDGAKAIYSIGLENQNGATITQILNQVGNDVTVNLNDYTFDDRATLSFVEEIEKVDPNSEEPAETKYQRVLYKDISLKNGTVNLLEDNQFYIGDFIDDELQVGEFSTEPYIESNSDGEYFAKNETLYFENHDIISSNIKAIFFKEGTLYIKSYIPTVNASGDYDGGLTENAYWHKIEIPAYIDSTYLEVMSMNEAQAEAFFNDIQSRVVYYLGTISSPSNVQKFVKDNFTGTGKSIDDLISSDFTVKNVEIIDGVPNFSTSKETKFANKKEAIYNIVRYVFGATDFISNKFAKVNNIILNAGYLYIIEETKVLSIKASNLLKYELSSNNTNWVSCDLGGLTYWGFDSDNSYIADVKYNGNASKLNLGGIWSILSAIKINGVLTSGSSVVLYGSIASTEDIEISYLKSRISLGRNTYEIADLDDSEKAELNLLKQYAGGNEKPIALYSANGSDFKVIECDGDSGSFRNAVEYLGNTYFFTDTSAYACETSNIENARLSASTANGVLSYKDYDYKNYNNFTILTGKTGSTFIVKNSLSVGMKIDYIKDNVIYLKAPVTEASIGKSNVLVSFNTAKQINSQIDFINKEYEKLYFNKFGGLTVNEIHEVEEQRDADRAYIQILGDESLFGLISNNKTVYNKAGNPIKACAEYGDYAIGTASMPISNEHFKFDNIDNCINILTSDTSKLSNEPAYYDKEEELTNSFKGQNIFVSKLYKSEVTPAIKIINTTQSFDINNYKSRLIPLTDDCFDFVLRYLNDNFDLTLTIDDALAEDSGLNFNISENGEISVEPFSFTINDEIHYFDFQKIPGLGDEKYFVHCGTNSNRFTHLVFKEKLNFNLDILSALYIKNEVRNINFDAIPDSKVSYINLKPKGFGGDRNNESWEYDLPWEIDPYAFEENEYLTNAYGDIVYLADDEGNIFEGHKGNFEIAENSVTYNISKDDFNKSTKDIVLYDGDYKEQERLTLTKIEKHELKAYTTYNDLFINGNPNSVTKLSFFIYRDWKYIDLNDCNISAYFIDKNGLKVEDENLIGNLVSIDTTNNIITIGYASKEYEKDLAKLRVYVSYGKEVVKVDYNILAYTTEIDAPQSPSIYVAQLYTFLRDIDGNYKFTGINLNNNEAYWANETQPEESDIFITPDGSSPVSGDAELNSTLYPIKLENKRFKINDLIVNSLNMNNEIGNSLISFSVNGVTSFINSPIIGIESIRAYINYNGDIKYIVDTEDYNNTGLFETDENNFVFSTAPNYITRTARDIDRLITKCTVNKNSILKVDNIYILENRTLNIENSKGLIVSGVKGNIAMRKPKFNSFYELIYGSSEKEGLGTVIENEKAVAEYSVKITDENSNPTILKTQSNKVVFNKALTGTGVDSDEVYDRLNNGKVHFLKIDFLTQKTYRYSSKNHQDPANFIEIPLDEIDIFTPDRVWFNPNGYIGSPIKIGNDIYREENNYAYTSKTYKNNNGYPIYECNEAGKCITYYVDSASADGVSKRVLTAGESIDKCFTPKKPKYESCKEWFKNKYFVEGENMNPFWQVLKIDSAYSQINKRWEQQCKLVKYEKLNNAIKEVVVGDTENLVTYQKPYYYTVENGIIYIDYEQDFVDTKNGELKIILYQGNEMYKDKETLIKFGITAYNSFYSDSKYFNGNAKLFNLGTRINMNSYLDSSYIVNSIENLANNNDKDAAIAEITEFGLFNKEHQLIAYGTFPPIEYRTDTQHVSFTCVVKNGAYSSVN